MIYRRQQIICDYATVFYTGSHRPAHWDLHFDTSEKYTWIHFIV